MIPDPLTGECARAARLFIPTAAGATETHAMTIDLASLTPRVLKSATAWNTWLTIAAYALACSYLGLEPDVTHLTGLAGVGVAGFSAKETARRFRAPSEGVRVLKTENVTGAAPGGAGIGGGAQ